MVKRTIAGMATAAAAYALLCFFHIPVLPKAAAALLGLFSAYEVFRATGAIKHAAYFIAAVLAAVLAPFLPLPYYAVALSAVFPLAVLFFVSMMIAVEDYSLDHPVKSLLLSLLLTFLLQAIPELSAMRHGRIYLLFAVTSSLSADAAAFAAGRGSGRHPLIPNISLEQTIEGAVCGIIYSSFTLLLCGFVSGRTANILIRPVTLLVYALTASVMGQCGGLSMTVIQRAAGAGDPEQQRSGHTGALNRFGSQLFTISFTYIFCCMTGGFLR